LTLDEIDSAFLGTAVRRAIFDVELRRRLSSEAQRLVDGLGAGRIASVLCRGAEKSTDGFNGQRAGKSRRGTEGCSIV